MNQQSVSASSFSQSQIAETDFEKRRGISRAEIRKGLTQVHVLNLPTPIAKNRINVLRAVAEAGVSLDFLKMTPTGLSFIVPAEKTETISKTLDDGGFTSQLDTNRGIVLVHAVNMRDEEGLIASILQRVISSGISIDHASDMHDRILIVTEESQAEAFSAAIEGDAYNG